MSSAWPWLVILALGAYHGINPAMGWLFAVALGLQEKSRRAVLKAIVPIALGHAVSIGIAISLLWLARASIPAMPLKYGAAAVLLGFALYRLIRSRHPRWVGMQVGFRDLALWSFLMASAHGAGLMLVPVLLAWPAAAGADRGSQMTHMSHASHSFAAMPESSGAPQWAAAVVLHTAAYLIMTTLVALLVYEKLGVGILRRAWVNLDLVWIIALLLSGISIVLIPHLHLMRFY